MRPDFSFFDTEKLIPGFLFCRHKSIIAYLASANLSHSSAALREELGDSITVDDSTLKKYEGLLEKKWTSVVRLQKKVGSLLSKVP